ncbi:MULTISPECIES: pyridoxal phosphate-dependent aminotransferase [Calditerrivibrio]|uniref:alanine transaminase n=1 Tax=Calditerrivibrio nitroreducens TaxID=477976 RepID=A0A2J6WMD0_9BACT|nr:MAG: aminotransferase [Calditerrivibrio nitroreducens]
MRSNIAKGNSGLTYEIRNIVLVAEELKKNGIEVTWENIGDPVNKGEIIPEWMKDIVKDVASKNESYAYSPTKGVLSTREYLANQINKRGGIQITPDDILFFNGLGDAVDKLYSCLRPDLRVLLPEPTYSSHYISEVAHGSIPPLTYRMNPANNWQPDLNEIREKVRRYKAIVGILVLNPDNPTGFVYPENLLKEIVQIAKENDLYLIFDEIYNKIVYNGKKSVLLADIVGDTPAISLKGISKEFPWPGSRCGWMEFYNTDKDESFKEYVNTIVQKKMSEVCSTTLPQMALPIIMEHPEYNNYLLERSTHYQKLSNIAYDILKENKYLFVNRTDGAFYMAVAFKDGILNNKMKLKIANKNVESFVEKLMDPDMELDKRFVYYLLGSTGICVVPLTSFYTDIPGFRMTLLEKDLNKFEKTVKTISDKVIEYVESV